MKYDLNALLEIIRNWAISRGLDKSTLYKTQMNKITEEIGELARGINRIDCDAIEDAIGDIFISLNVLCVQLNINLEACVHSAYTEIKDRKGKIIDGMYIKEEDFK